MGLTGRYDLGQTFSSALQNIMHNFKGQDPGVKAATFITSALQTMQIVLIITAEEQMLTNLYVRREFNIVKDLSPEQSRRNALLGQHPRMNREVDKEHPARFYRFHTAIFPALTYGPELRKRDERAISVTQ
ncbi:unnamed protein product [Haemonchus placei]|uniref:CACTA en-spm transposon protein n=1 Tax=Haemonchus placei TaxID=6290 RepID=A0A0N4W6P3_HAEPC|nr:unnamed protein product [Haemonchus placei]